MPDILFSHLPGRLFDHRFHTEKVAKDLKKELGDEAEIMVSGVPGIRVECGETSCIFEFITYKYKGQVKEEENQPHVVAPNNETVAQPPTSSMMRSNSLPIPAPFPWLYFVSQQDYTSFLASMSGIPQQGPAPAFRRSNTMSGPYPEHLQHQPGDEVPNNDTEASNIASQEPPFDDGHVVEGRGRGRGGSALHQQGTATPGVLSGQPASLYRARGGGMGSRGRGMDRVRHHSSSSGLMSSVSEEENVTSD